MKPPILFRVLVPICLSTLPLSGYAETFADLIDSSPLPVIQQAVKRDTINIPDDNGFTPLHRAVTSDREDKQAVIALLLENGADANASSTKGGTVIQHAISAGDVEAVKRLLKAGADLNKPGSDEVSSLERIAWVKQPETIVALFDLLKLHAPDQITKHGGGAFFMCVDRVNLTFAQLLILEGIKPSPKERQEITAFLSERLNSDDDTDNRQELLTLQEALKSLR